MSRYYNRPVLFLIILLSSQLAIATDGVWGGWAMRLFITALAFAGSAGQPNDAGRFVVPKHNIEEGRQPCGFKLVRDPSDDTYRMQDVFCAPDANTLNASGEELYE